jgi:hypothetical protein
MSHDANAAYEADAGLAPPDHNIRQAINFLIQELFNRRRAVDAAAAALRDAQDALADVQERRLPDMMQEMGIPANGSIDHVDEYTGEHFKIKLVQGLMVSQPPVQDVSRRDAIYAWLRRIGQGGLIKKTATAVLGQRSDDEVAGVVADFKQAYPDIDITVADRVEAASFSKLVRTLKERGENIDENVSVTPFREARISAK